MATHSLDGALGRLRTAAAVRAFGGLSDGELLGRFVGSHDEAAFTVLVERHGQMVLGVCRRALSDPHDAEDACQAAFLVLARKAGSLRKQASLGSFLHGVAVRTSATLERDAARRRSRERAAAPPPPADPAAEATWREVQAILDEELGRLPERYRDPLILCYLECLTRDEAAARLGLSAGALHGLLERGRALLRGRLGRRGLALSSAALAAASGESVAHALPPTFVVSSVRAAVWLAAGQPLTGAVGANALALTREVLKSMSLAKSKLGAAAVLCVALIALAGSLTSLGFAQDDKKKEDAFRASVAAEKAESDEDFIRRLSKDLRGTDATPAEVHFFVTSKEAGKRQKLIDLFIQERQAKKQAGAPKDKAARDLRADPDDPLKAVEMRDRVEKEQREHQAKLAEKKAAPPPTDLECVVERIDPKDASLVSLSRGSDAGLAAGQELEVCRMKPEARYLGKIRVIETSPGRAVARLVGKTPPLKAGDQVFSAIRRRPAEKKE